MLVTPALLLLPVRRLPVRRPASSHPLSYRIPPHFLQVRRLPVRRLSGCTSGASSTAAGRCAPPTSPRPPPPPPPPLPRHRLASASPIAATSHRRLPRPFVQNVNVFKFGSDSIGICEAGGRRIVERVFDAQQKAYAATAKIQSAARRRSSAAAAAADVAAAAAAAAAAEGGGGGAATTGCTRTTRGWRRPAPLRWYSEIVRYTRQRFRRRRAQATPVFAISRARYGTDRARRPAETLFGGSSALARP